MADLAEVGVTADSNLTSAVWPSAVTRKAKLRRVSVADCFSIELAERLQATILTADHHEFDTLTKHLRYRIEFIR